MKKSIEIKNINTLLNETPQLAIKEADERYRGFIDEAAKKVKNSGVKVVFLAGPSGSGKTTTANTLKDRIIAYGGECLVVSLDDFYRDATDPMYPRDENGERDYENPLALNIPEVEKTPLDIAAGKDFYLPKYDFKVGGRVEYNRHSAIKDGCVIIEGLHALNPLIADVLPSGSEMKIFISVSTNITNKGRRIISGRKLRFIRRVVRDSIYRGADAVRTLNMWANVRKGEDMYLYPYRNTADVTLDTFHIYELAVMKNFAEGLISDKLAKTEPYANVVLKALKKSVALDPTLVPENALVREFIGGGIYDHIY